MATYVILRTMPVRGIFEDSIVLLKFFMLYKITKCILYFHDSLFDLFLFILDNYTKYQNKSYLP